MVLYYIIIMPAFNYYIMPVFGNIIKRFANLKSRTINKTTMLSVLPTHAVFQTYENEN